MEASSPPAKKACPVCTRGQMETLNEIIHEDGAVTIYWRCATCSHVQVLRTPARDRNENTSRRP
jgi:uncharacterized Zn finger protein